MSLKRRISMDDVDRELLNVLQRDFPLTARPFRAIGEKLGKGEQEVMDRIIRLKEGKIIRQISAIFDSRRLGYRGSLVAMMVGDDRIDEVAAQINEHPGVSHNYKRNHEFDLWFTITVPPGVEVEDEVEALARKTSPKRTVLLPTLRLFKIGVNFDMTGKEAATKREKPPTVSSSSRMFEERMPAPSPYEIDLIRALQKDLPIVEEPFRAEAEALGISVEQLLDGAKSFIESKKMRRFAAVLHHRRAGYAFNGMAVWRVPTERIEEVGPKMASYAKVSHCYERPVYPWWPYNVFTMVHGMTKEACEEVVQAIADETKIDDYAVLYSTKEYKKTRVQYFTEDQVTRAG